MLQIQALVQRVELVANLDNFTLDELLVQIKDGKDKGKSALWIMAAKASNGNPEIFLKVFEKFKEEPSFLAGLLAPALAGPSKGKSALWGLACVVDGKLDFFLLVWEKFKDEPLFLAALLVPAQEGPDKGKSVFRWLAGALAYGKSGNFLLVWEKNKDNLSFQSALLAPDQTPDQSSGRSALWMLAYALNKGRSEVFIQVWEKIKEKPFVVAALFAQAKGDTDKGISPLWLLADVLRKGKPEAFVVVWEKIKEEPFLLAALLAQPQDGPNKGKSALMLLGLAAQKGDKKISDPIISILKYILMQKRGVIPVDAPEVKILIKLNVATLELIQARNAFFEACIKSHGSCFNLAEKAQSLGYINAFYELGFLFYQKNDWVNAENAYAKLSTLSDNYQQGLVEYVAIKLMRVLSENIGPSFSEHLPKIQDKTIREDFAKVGDLVMAQRKVFQTDLKNQNRKQATVLKFMFMHAPASLVGVWGIRFKRWSPLMSSVLTDNAKIDLTTERADCFAALLLAKALEKKAVLINLLKQIKILHPLELQSLLPQVIMLDEFIISLIEAGLVDEFNAEALFAAPGCEKALIKYIKIHLAEINLKDIEKQDLWVNRFKHIKLPVSVVEIVLKDFCKQIKLSTSKKDLEVYFNNHHEKRYNLLRDLVNSCEWLAPLPEYTLGTSSASLTVKSKCTLASYYGLINALNAKLNKLEEEIVVTEQSVMARFSALTITPPTPTPSITKRGLIVSPSTPFFNEKKTKKNKASSNKPHISSSTRQSKTTAQIIKAPQQLVPHVASKVVQAGPLPLPESGPVPILIPRKPIDFQTRDEEALSPKISPKFEMPTAAVNDLLKLKFLIASRKAESKESYLMHDLMLFDRVSKINREISEKNREIYYFDCDLIHNSHLFLHRSGTLSPFYFFVVQGYTGEEIRVSERLFREAAIIALRGDDIPEDIIPIRLQLINEVIKILALAHQLLLDDALSGSILVLGEQFSRLAEESPEIYRQLTKTDALDTIVNEFRDYRNLRHGARSNLKIVEVEDGTDDKYLAFINQSKDWADQLARLKPNMDAYLEPLKALLANTPDRILRKQLTRSSYMI